ncbi:hypothetical protein OYT1_ch0899 [Ferriphaselus amnicola]|uniref:Uncharacterized protein n=1 Tax=Ferriphaselus amnicola TaxID=1188319 RepID=A0A2Z6GAM2_9PROT|nr:hypothetical protein OYT1_ch0899 [Ferriphaselus amnicola]
MLCLCLLTGLCHAQANEAYFDASTIRAADLPKNPPTFSDYSVPVFVGELAEPDVKSHPRSRLFRSKIREGAKRGPNFAGHYTIVGWGCGSSCGSLAIVDATTGQVFHPKNLDAIDNINVDYDALEGSDESLIKYRPDSRLLVIIGGINEDPKLRGISYFVWEHDKLRRVRFVHKPFEVK